MTPSINGLLSGGRSVEVIQGSGEMADRIRAYAWERTPLGPVASWSETLVVAVNLMLFSPFSFAIYWGSEQILLYNDVYREFLGEKHPLSLGSNGPAVWAEAWSVLSEPIRAAFEEGRSTSARGALIPILIDGVLQDRWWTYGFNPIFEGGSIVGVANPGHDDTAAVLAQKALRKSEEELQLAMESAALGMWHYDPKLRVVFADDRSHRIFDASQLNGAVDQWFALLHPEDRERVGQQLAGALEGKHPYDIEYRFLRGDEVRWVRSKGRVIGPEGRPERMFAILEDITERKQAEAALQQTDKLATVGRMAASIAHEINNPLESVTNLLFLIRGSQDLDLIHEYVATAERELRRVSLITNQTLRFHRQSTKAALTFCSDLIQDSLSMLQGRILNQGIQVEKRKRAEQAVYCFYGEIRQVLNNLIGNAIDAMPSGGRLLVRSREGAEYPSGRRGLVITVADTGIGMGPEVQRRVFEAFYTTKGMSGTGLGLWISKEIVLRHGGVLRFRSSQTPGRSGTVFTLFLPYGDAGGAPTHAGAAGEGEGGTRP